MVLAMINEASLILDEKIVGSAGELDLAMIMGTGFPPFRGGLLRYADSMGLPYIVSRLDELSSTAGGRYKPNAPLVRLAQRDGKFYQAYARS
jgi:3-hydroxyacyl-CoA dehydrogenase/enoyl-CoA hydratase/3-hydroxybutyryl-CoA epimerase